MGSCTLQNSKEKRVLALKSLQFKLSMQNKETGGMQKQTLNTENECSDDWMWRKEFFEDGFGVLEDALRKHILC